MTLAKEIAPSAPEQISERIGHRASGLYWTHQLWCSGAALFALNKGLGGDLTLNQVKRLTTMLSNVLSDNGCICGGLNGASLAIGRFLGDGSLTPQGSKTVLNATRMLHDQFKEAFGTICCRALIKREPSGSQEQLLLCAHRTSLAASLAAQLILLHKPELAQHVDWYFLNNEDTSNGAHVKMIANRL